MKYFVSTGEASGELSALVLADAMRVYDPDARFEGIGGDAMRAAGFELWRNHAGWASMGPLAAIPRIPKLLTTMWLAARHIAKTKPDLVVLVDFGAFNIRLAKALRRSLNYAGPILDLFPPATWLDNEARAREVSSYAVPLTAFEHQYNFYKRHQLPILYFGHPLVSRYAQRPPRPPADPHGGCVALLPGSRSGELRYHVPMLLQAFRLLKARRPELRGVFGAANGRVANHLRNAIARAQLRDISVVCGVAASVADADAAWVSSGTAVLETTLLGVPSIAFYIIAPLLVQHARRVYSGEFIALPNLVVRRALVPELLQDAATPLCAADAMEQLLCDPQKQYVQFAELRRALGPPDALDRCAKFAVSLARVGEA